MSNLGLLNLKGLGRYSGKTKGLKCWQLDQVKVQGTCVGFLERVWALGTMRTACIEKGNLKAGCEVRRPRKTVSPPLWKTWQPPPSQSVWATAGPSCSAFLASRQAPPLPHSLRRFCLACYSQSRPWQSVWVFCLFVCLAELFGSRSR